MLHLWQEKRQLKVFARYLPFGEKPKKKERISTNAQAVVFCWGKFSCTWAAGENPKHDSSERPGWAALPTSCCGHSGLFFTLCKFPHQSRLRSPKSQTFRCEPFYLQTHRSALPPFPGSQKLHPSTWSRPGPPLSSGALPALTVPGHLTSL